MTTKKKQSKKGIRRPTKKAKAKRPTKKAKAKRPTKKATRTSRKTSTKRPSKKTSGSPSSPPAAPGGQVDMIGGFDALPPGAEYLPADLAVPAAVLADLFDVTQARVRQLADAETIQKNARDRYALRDSVRGYVRYLKRLRSESEIKRSEDVRLTKARADAKELEVSLATGKLYQADQVDHALFVVCTQLGAMLDGASSRIAGELGGGAVLRLKLQNEFREIRNQFAAGLREYSDSVATGSGDSGSAAGSAAGKMGTRKSRATKGKRGAGTV